MKSIFIRFWAVLFLITIWFVFTSPYFIKGKVPYASTYQVNFFAPWSHYQEFWGPVKNNAMPDVHTQIYPWKKFTIDTFGNNQIPLWNPYAFSGNPYLANFQSAVFTPFNLLFFLFSFIDAWSILILLQPLLAGIFMFLFVRVLGVSNFGALISSVAFMFCGFIVVWMAYGTLAYAILYLPLALFAIEKYFQKKDLKFLLLLTLTIPLSFFSGHFQISLYFLITVLFYSLYKKNFNLLLAIFLGLIIASLQIFPSIKLYLNSVRSGLFQVSEAIPFQYLITAVAPDFLGNPVTRNDWFGHYAEWASFVGIWPFILAIYAVSNLKNQISKIKNIIFFTLLGFISLILAVNSPLSSLFVSLKIPVLSTSALSRIIVLASFALSVLSGLGFDQLKKDLQLKNSPKKIKLVLAIITIFFCVIWLIVISGKFMPGEWLIVAKRNFILPSALFLIGALLIILSTKKRMLIPVTLCYILLATSFDSLRFAQKWMPFDPRKFVYPSVPIINVVKQRLSDNGRIWGNLGGEFTTYYKIPSIEGYDPLYIGRYGEFIQSAQTGQFEKAERSVVRLGRRAIFTDRVLDLLGVSLVFNPIADTNQGWAYPVWANKGKYELVYGDDKFELYKNNLALPRASLFYDFEQIGSDQEIIRKFYSQDFNFRKQLIIEEEIKGVNKVREGTGSANIISYTPNKVAIEVNTTTPALLFLSDNYYPGWKARVNGVETKIYRADYTFRAIVVPADRSSIEFTYENLYF